jgi:hypothetical protein
MSRSERPNESLIHSVGRLLGILPTESTKTAVVGDTVEPSSSSTSSIPSEGEVGLPPTSNQVDPRREVWVPYFSATDVQIMGQEWPEVYVEKWETNLLGESRFVGARWYTLTDKTSLRGDSTPDIRMYTDVLERERGKDVAGT